MWLDKFFSYYYECVYVSYIAETFLLVAAPEPELIWFGDEVGLIPVLDFPKYQPGTEMYHKINV